MGAPLSTSTNLPSSLTHRFRMLEVSWKKAWHVKRSHLSHFSGRLGIRTFSKDHNRC